MPVIFYWVPIYILKLLLFIVDILDVILFLILKLFFDKSLSQKVLSQHALTEEDSAWQVLSELRRKGQVESQKLASLIQHAIEERDHSDMFKALLSKEGLQYFKSNRTQRDPEKLTCNNEFFIKVGEQAAIQKYKLLLLFRVMPMAGKVYDQILQEEEEHKEKIVSGEEDLQAYFIALYKYFNMLIAQKLNRVFSLIFKLVIIPFYFIIFTPVAKISLLFQGSKE